MIEVSFGAREKPVCWKCGGSGQQPQWSHIAKGVCFPCGGTGRAWPPPRPARVQGTKPWAPHGSTQHIEYIKHWLTPTPDQLARLGETEEIRWWQIGAAVGHTIFDPTMFPRALARGRLLADASPWKWARTRFDMGVASGLGSTLGYEVPADVIALMDGFEDTRVPPLPTDDNGQPIYPR